jgi:hypothetical protein
MSIPISIFRIALYFRLATISKKKNLTLDLFARDGRDVDAGKHGNEASVKPVKVLEAPLDDRVTRL